jgi:hypothetical protein
MWGWRRKTLDYDVPPLRVTRLAQANTAMQTLKIGLGRGEYERTTLFWLEPKILTYS